MKTAIAAALLICLVGVAHANVLYPDAITFGPAYAMGPPYGIPWFGGPADGAPLLIAGVVTAVGPPFNDLLPAGSYEMTWVLEGASCTGSGNWDDFSCQRGGEYFTFSGGTISVFLDLAPDADFTDLNTFRDGELVLLARSSLTNVMDDDPDGICLTENYPDVDTFFSTIGGAWYHRVNGGAGFVKGEISYPGNVPAPLQALGYVLRIDGTMDVFGPVATRPTTWGKVKALYR